MMRYLFLSLFLARVLTAEISDEEALSLRRIADFWEEGEYQIAKRQMESFLEEFPDSSYKNTLSSALGDLFLREKSYQTALNYYTQIQDPTISARIFLHRMQCLYHLEWHATLADECEAFLKNPESDPANRLQTTYLLAIALYSQALTTPKNSEMLTNLAERAKPYFEHLANSELSGEVADAFAHLQCILKDFESASKIYLDLAKKSEVPEENLFQAALIQSKYDKNLALETFNQLASQKEGAFAAEASYNMLVLYFEQGRHEEIVEGKETFLQSVPSEKVGLAHLFVGQSYLHLKKYAEAAAELTAFLDSDIPEDQRALALLHLVEAAYHSEDLALLDQAIARFEKDNSEMPKALFSRALIYKKQERIAEAKDALKALLSEYSAFPERAEASFELVRLYSADKEWGLCREGALLFLQEFPKHELTPFTWRLLLSASTENFIGDLERMLKEQDFLSLSERRDWEFHLAKAHFEKGGIAEAMRILTPLLETESANAKLLFAICVQKGASFIIPTQDAGERGCQGAPENASFLGYGIDRSISTDESIVKGAIDEEENRYGKAAAGRSPVGIMKEAQKGDEANFCIWAEKALGLGATLLPVSQQHLALFNSYLRQNKVDLGADHLYAALMEDAKLQPSNLFWLADLFYKRYEKDPSLATPAFNVLSRVARNSLQDSEPFLVKLAIVQRHLGRPEESISTLEELDLQYRASPQTGWSCEKEARVRLAEMYLASNAPEKAEKLFDEVASSGLYRDRFTVQAALESVRLKLPFKDDAAFENGAARLKDLILQKKLEHEPLHLEAALDYVDLLSKNNPEKRGVLLRKIKGDFESNDTLVSKDYHAAREKFPEKSKIYLAYMQYLEAELLSQEKELHTKAKETLLQIRSEAEEPLLSRVESLLKNI